MPRRNRNAYALAIDTDELAAQAAQLTTELSSMHIRPVSPLVEEIQLGLGGIPSGGKPVVLINDLTQQLKQHPGGTVAVIDIKHALAEVVTSHGR